MAGSSKTKNRTYSDCLRRMCELLLNTSEVNIGLCTDHILLLTSVSDRLITDGDEEVLLC